MGDAPWFDCQIPSASDLALRTPPSAAARSNQCRDDGPLRSVSLPPRECVQGGETDAGWGGECVARLIIEWKAR